MLWCIKGNMEAYKDQVDGFIPSIVSAMAIKEFVLFKLRYGISHIVSDGF